MWFLSFFLLLSMEFKILPFFIVYYYFLGEFEAFRQWWEKNLCYHCQGVSSLSLFCFDCFGARGIMCNIHIFKTMMLWLFVILDVRLEPPLNETFHEIEGDNGKVLPKNMMEDVAWVHEGSRWICKFDAYINWYTIKWLCYQNVTNTRSSHGDGQI